MERLFNFIYNYRAFLTFLSLEFLCSWLLIVNNQYQSSKYFNTSNAMVAKISMTEANITEYFSLREINAKLAVENASLRNSLESNEELISKFNLGRTDSAFQKKFDFVNARVVNNSTRYYKNFITIDRGREDGVEPSMAVINHSGVVGKVKSVSDHYAVVISMLNIDEQISSTIKRTGQFGTIQWDGLNPFLINLKYIPRHVNLHVGDSIVTSGYNAIFPADVFIGKIKEFQLRDEALFYDIKVELGQDFGRLIFVEVIKNHQIKERDSLENVTVGERQ